MLGIEEGDLEDSAGFGLKPGYVVTLHVLQDAVEQVNERLLLLRGLVDVVDELLGNLLSMMPVVQTSELGSPHDMLLYSWISLHQQLFELFVWRQTAAPFRA